MKSTKAAVERLQPRRVERDREDDPKKLWLNKGKQDPEKSGVANRQNGV